jgi:hypothetical protein
MDNSKARKQISKQDLVSKLIAGSRALHEQRIVKYDEDAVLMDLLAPEQGLNVNLLSNDSHVVAYILFIKRDAIPNILSRLYNCIIDERVFSVSITKRYAYVFLNLSNRVVVSAICIALAAYSYPQLKYWIDLLFP